MDAFLLAKASLQQRLVDSVLVLIGCIEHDLEVLQREDLDLLLDDFRPVASMHLDFCASGANRAEHNAGISLRRLSDHASVHELVHMRDDVLAGDLTDVFFDVSSINLLRSFSYLSNDRQPRACRRSSRYLLK